VSTASCHSAITYIDGDAGILRYRGYPIEQLAEQSTFLEVAYLLLNGELPDRTQLAQFTSDVTHHTMLNQSLLKFYNGFHHNAHRWRSWSGSWARCRPSITTPSTSITRSTARSARCA